MDSTQVIEQSLVRVKAAVVLPGFAVATEAIPGMTVRVDVIGSRVDVNSVFFAQVLGKIVYGVKFVFGQDRIRSKKAHHISFGFGIRADFAAVFAVIHLHSVLNSVFASNLRSQ